MIVYRLLARYALTTFRSCIRTCIRCNTNPPSNIYTGLQKGGKCRHIRTVFNTWLKVRRSFPSKPLAQKVQHRWSKTQEDQGAKPPENICPNDLVAKVLMILVNLVGVHSVRLNEGCRNGWWQAWRMSESVIWWLMSNMYILLRRTCQHVLTIITVVDSSENPSSFSKWVKGSSALPCNMCDGSWINVCDMFLRTSSRKRLRWSWRLIVASVCTNMSQSILKFNMEFLLGARLASSWWMPWTRQREIVAIKASTVCLKEIHFRCTSGTSTLFPSIYDGQLVCTTMVVQKPLVYRRNSKANGILD